MSGPSAESADVVIVGAGPAGLTAARHRPFPRVTVRQAGRVIARRRLPWPVSPGRVFRAPWDLFSQAHPEAGDVVVELCP